jgi:periplasmic copper chaperone A
MKSSVIRAALAAAAFTFALPAIVSAETFSIGNITVETPWTRATPGGAKVAGGYLRIVNNGSEADRLIGGTSEIAQRFEVHSMEMRDGVARMAPVEGGLEIPAGETVELAPGGYHVMLMGLERPLSEGETVAGTLVFERAGTLEISYPVAAMGVRTPPGEGGHSHDHEKPSAEHAHDHDDGETCHHDTTPGHTR